MIVLFHNSFSPSGEKPEKWILAYKSEQPTAVCIEIFHKYGCYIKHGGIIRNLTLRNPWGVCYWYVKIPLCGCVEHVSECITFYVKKYMVPGPLLVRNKPLGAPPFVRLAYRTWYAGAWVHNENMSIENISAVCKSSFLSIFRDGGDFRGNPVLHNNCAVKFGMAEYGWGLSPETKKKARLELNEIPETRQMALEAVRQQMITRPDISEYNWGPFTNTA